VLLVGSHGIELRLDEPDDVLALDAEEQEQLGVLGQVLDQIVDTLDSVWLEPKPAGFALHTRLATERHSRVAHLVAINELKAEAPEAKVRLGKNVIEFSVRSTTKGEAVEHLRRYTHATAVFYAGDDVTDEDAFVALTADDFGLKSGDGPTAADHRVHGPQEVAAVLSLLADLRATRVQDTPGTN
jgi:trehalose 6-phosphate phosphatase